MKDIFLRWLYLTFAMLFDPLDSPSSLMQVGMGADRHFLDGNHRTSRMTLHVCSRLSLPHFEIIQLAMSANLCSLNVRSNAGEATLQIPCILSSYHFETVRAESNLQTSMNPLALCVNAAS